MTTPQAPSGHTTRPRPRAYAIGHKVNPLLNDSPFHSSETWLLPMSGILCVIRYIVRPKKGGGATIVKIYAEFLPSPELLAARNLGPARNLWHSTLLVMPRHANSLSSPGPSWNIAWNLRTSKPSACPELPAPEVQSSPDRANSLDRPDPRLEPPAPGPSGPACAH